MLAIKVLEIKGFMKKLFMENVFDAFYVRSMEFQTMCSFKIEGRLNKDFYSKEEQEIIGKQKYVKWEELRDFAYNIIKGNKTPLSFEIIFMLQEKNVEKIAEMCKNTVNFDDISGLFLNVKYDKSGLMITSGTSRNTFTLDKTLDYVWEEQIKRFMKYNKIAIEEQ